ncbi:DUF6624 domain-containing protein [Streptomyces sp. CB02115]|uniref:DUF6624 domain-containing protein n=1 Tax=Streptomyces sp. CB02115 TaxID=1703939 RepID=UPI00093A3BD6|nr:DUF6624 domain-containing protein [Streptomyces sp. CB02115]
MSTDPRPDDGAAGTAPCRRPDIARTLIGCVENAVPQWARIARSQITEHEIEMFRHVDHANAQLLGRVIRDHGWPGYRLVGEDGARAAWWIALHADSLLTVQNLALQLMHEAVRQGDASLPQWAHLTDRALTNAHKLQEFGTQYRQGASGLERQPVHAPDTLDQRRIAMGLVPGADALETLRRRLDAAPRYGALPGEPPADLSGTA